MSIAISPKEQKSDVINNAIRELQQGKDNACGIVSLAINTTTTVVPAVVANATCNVFLQATTSNAALEVGNGTIWVSSITKGSFTITHANNAQADRTFYWTIRGGH